MLKLFSVYDNALKEFNPPTFLHGRGVAFRAFQDAVNAPDNPFGKHPDDYTLFELGTFEGQTGEIKMNTAPERICSARDVLNVQVDPNGGSSGPSLKRIS